MYIGNVMLLVLNLPLVGIWVQLLRVPFGIMAPVIILFTAIGSYSIQNQAFDIYSLIGFGLFGYLLRKLKFEPGPLVLAFVLGPMIEAIDAAVASHVGGELLDLRDASHLDGPDRAVRASRHRSGRRDVAKEIPDPHLKGEER